MQAPIDDPIPSTETRVARPLPGPCFLLGHREIQATTLVQLECDLIDGVDRRFFLLALRRYEMKRSWRVPIFLSVVSNERGDMGYWVSSRNVVVVIRARRPAWWPRLKIWLGRFRKGKP